MEGNVLEVFSHYGFHSEHCFIWLRELDTKKIGAKIFGELPNIELEDNGEDRMVGENN